MAVSNFAATRADLQNGLWREPKRTERYGICQSAREEMRHILSLKGFSGEQLDRVVEVITADPRVWVDIMMVEERDYSVARESRCEPRA